MQLRTYVRITLDPSLGELILTHPDLKVVHMQKHALKKKCVIHLPTCQKPVTISPLHLVEDVTIKQI